MTGNDIKEHRRGKRGGGREKSPELTIGEKWKELRERLYVFREVGAECGG